MARDPQGGQLPLTRSKQDAQFWQVVKDLHWRLDDGSGGPPPPADHGFDRGGGGGAWPTWATHLIAFLLGGLTWGSLLLAPPAMPVLVLVGLIGLVTLAVRRRWR